MAKFRFHDRIPIDEVNTLKQLLARFRGVKDGLPELIKNAKDQYSRLGIHDATSRVIVVLIDGKRHRLGVVDFAGAPAGQFKRWERWSDPMANARERSADIEGGHGNGGKAFMVLGSNSDSSFESCVDGRRTRMGYDNSDEAEMFKPGIALEDGKPVMDVRVSSMREQLDIGLSGLGVRLDRLPQQARDVFARRQSFTIAQVNGIRDWARARAETVRRSIAELPSAVETHPQAALTLESCSVWFVVNGKVVGDGPAHVRFPEPFSGFPEPLSFPVPDELVDPRTKDRVKTGAGDGMTKVLIIRTSARSLSTQDMKPLHVIRVRNSRNVVGLWPVSNLSPGAYSGFIFGELRMPSIEGEHLVGADRVSLNDTPLLRAVESWVGERIKEVADRIQQMTARAHSTEDCERINESLERLRNLMRDFLSERERGLEGAGRGEAGDGPEPPPPPPPPKPRGSAVDVIEIEGRADSIALAVGARIPLRVRAFEEAATGELLPVPSPMLVPKVEHENIVSVNEDYQALAIAPGRASLWFESRDGKVRSNVIDVEAVPCHGATLSGIPERPLLQGEHLAIKIAYSTSAGVRDDLLHDASVDEEGMGRISRGGTFIAGTSAGDATVRVRWGPNQIDTSCAVASVGTERVPPPKGIGADHGGDIPRILICGTPAPGMDHYPPQQRTIMPSEHMPTIIDYEPEFENIIFINPNSKESVQSRKGRGGRKGMAGIATPTYCQFVALKCFEILKRLWVFEHAKEAPLTEVQFRQQFASAEMECATFIGEAYKIAEAITDSGDRTGS